jgi:hypothetical protein
MTADEAQPFPLGSASEDEDLDDVDGLGGPGRAGANPAKDVPALELGVGTLAGPALAGVGGVDVLMVLRQPAVAAGVPVQPAASLRIRPRCPIRR